MSHISRMTMLGLYNYDSALFDKLTLPDGISKPDFINSFLLKYGECPVMYPNWEFMQFALGAWGVKWYDSIERIIKAFTEEYNPLHNFDRHEEYSDTEGIGRTGSSTRNRTEDTNRNSHTNNSTNGTSSTNTEGTEDRYTDSTTNRNTTSEDTVSAFNENDYQPDRKNNTVESVSSTENGNTESSGSSRTTDTLTQNGSGTDVIKNTASDTQSDTEKTDRNLKHAGHLYGNIGVTESTTMLMHEKTLRENYNIIDIVCDMLFKEVCMYIY